MQEAVPVNFHCHTLFSDGDQTPEALAASLAQAGVRYAALTDHDSIEAMPRFQDALRKRGIASIAGVEITVQFHQREAHLLGYGFDPSSPELLSTLLCLRQAQNSEVHSIAGSLRKAGMSHAHEEGVPAAGAAPYGSIDMQDAIGVIHRAGGRAFWAHPWMYEPDPARMDALIGELKGMGLDGIEAIYTPFTPEQQAALLGMARKHALLVSAGTDYHSSSRPGKQEIAVGMPRDAWKQFRAALFTSPTLSQPAPGRDSRPLETRTTGSPPRRHPLLRRRYLALRIFLPTFTAILLFMAAFWGLILPSVERTLLEQKRNLTRDLTDSVWSILAAYEADERAGLLSHEQAQSLAITDIGGLRYGDEGKDYFWIQDTQPRMIMHPYRADLNGQDLTGLTDTRGIPIFVEFAALVDRQGEGYVDYVWQWNDDPQRLEAKESYVKGFAPWGWIIGTGLYVEDVRRDIASIEQSLINISLVISGAIVLLLMFVLQQSVRIERERQEVVDDLHESTERYHSLVEATTEGTLLVLDDHCRYANHTFLEMLGYTSRQLEFLELHDLLPDEECNAAFWERMRQQWKDTPPAGDTFEGCLVDSAGERVESVLSLTPIQVAGHSGFILLAKDVARQAAGQSDSALGLAARHAPTGIFRAQPVRRCVFTDMNPTCQELLGGVLPREQAQPALADLFSDADEYDQVLQRLLQDGAVDEHLLHIETRDASARFLSLSARLVRGENQQPLHIAGTLSDVTAARRHEAGREAQIERLQSSLLFLHEPLTSVQRQAVMCGMDTSIEQFSRLLTEQQATAGLITSETGAVIGIVTDHDLRERVLAERVPLSDPVYTIMSAPVTRIADSALIYEALLRMEERGVRHLAVEDHDGKVVGVIDSKSLIQFQRYGPIVLAREIARAASPAEVARHCLRTAPLVKTLLDSSARPRHVTSMLASICDAATERLIQLAVNEMGRPPAPFAFIAMGSQGRQEQTLLTDQDNGILYATGRHADPQAVRAYFLELGSRVCAGLHEAGYRLCEGQVMASNPRWCRSLPEWIAAFDEWVQRSEPQEIVDFSIFFDFRTVYGEPRLAQELRQHIHAALVDAPAFFHHVAMNVQQFKPPFRLLGSIYLNPGSSERGEINLKDAMMPVVSFARLYTLHRQLNHTNTIARVEALAEAHAVLPSSRDEITAAYDFLMQLRLRAQLAAIAAGQAPVNTIQPNKLGYIQKELLKQAFAQIAAVQKKVSYDFLGGG